MTPAQSTAAVILSASLAMQFGPALNRPGIPDSSPPVQDAAVTAAGASRAAAPKESAAVNLPDRAAPSGDAAQEAPLSPWRSPLLPPKFPAVVLFGPEPWALAVVDSVPERIRSRVTWECQDDGPFRAEKSIVLYADEVAAEYVERDGLVKTLEALE